MSEASAYVKKLLAAYDASPESFPAGSFGTVHVYHDDGCPFLAGDGPCSCNPDIEIETRSEPNDS